MRKLLLLLAVYLRVVDCEILTPPYFNLAGGRKITATATCGDEEAELYCKLVGANAENDENINVIQGQECDYCDLKSPDKRHPPDFAVNGKENWWQSPPLSRGMKYNEVNLTIDLGQEFHVAYVFVRMGNSPRPGLWALEKSSDYGKTYTPWQYFSDSPNDCETHFGKESLLPITRDDSVVCNMEYSKIVPLEGGEIVISLLNSRPSAKSYFNSTVLQEWTRATNVRLRLLRTKTLLGHLMSVARQDPTVTRRYFYSIKDISIGGRCMCNGHADICDIPDLKDPNKLQCRCQDHTCGPQCAQCCPGFEQKAWRQSQYSKKFVCEACNCFDHSNECKYDAEVDKNRLSLDIHGKYDGGGVCQNCQHNTEGVNCNKCKSRFYRPYNKFWNETDVCQPCDCHRHNLTGNCAEGTGQCECRKEFKAPYCNSCSEGHFGFPTCQPCTCNMNGTDGNFCEPESFNERCPCKYNFAGIYCEQCANGYYNLPQCQECACNPIGALGPACDQQSGNCTCKNNFGGRSCDHCQAGFFDYPSCRSCNCDISGTIDSICNPITGTCLCKEGFGGPRCNQCNSGFYSEIQNGEQTCVECGCSTIGSTSTSCDGGKCSCIYNFAGEQCTKCSPGHYKYPECLPCKCDTIGSTGVTCIDGQCQCKPNYDDRQCNSCKEGFYNFPTCEECNCDPGGVIQSFAGCGSVPAGELCQCKDKVQGRICDECRPLFWNLHSSNPHGCEDCGCFLPGTQGGIGVCDTKSGQCACRYSVGERTCNDCIDGFYNLNGSNIFGCTDCGCNIGGSVNNICEKDTGQCLCKPRIDGLQCDKPLKTHYFPTLHQYQYEVEDANTPSTSPVPSPVRYGFLQNQFPNFSWKGYAVFSFLQNEIIQSVQIYKSSVYRMVMYYVNPNPEPIFVKIIITPDHASESEQNFKVLLKPTSTPQFVTISDPQEAKPSSLVMNPGNWLVTIKTEKNMFLDYFSLIPAAYYEATILTQNVDNVCIVGQKGLCRHFGFPNISSFDSVRAGSFFTSVIGQRSAIEEFITNQEQLKELKLTEIPVINANQKELLSDMIVSKTGPHVILVEYVTPMDVHGKSNHSISVTARGSTAQEYSKVKLNECLYTMVCRQVLTDDSSRVKIFDLQDNFIGLTIQGSPGTFVGIKSLVAIPLDQWHLDYIKPQSVCVRRDGKCVQTEFSLAPGSKKVEFESASESKVSVLPWNIFDNNTGLVYLNDSQNIDIASKVPLPGQYVFIVQYYQPDYPEFDMTALILNGKFQEAILPIKHCPSNSGCRAVIQTQNGNNRFTLTENFILTLKESPKHHVWLDYLLVVPASQYSDSLLNKNRMDQTRDFISSCGNNNFHIDVSDEGFCRDAVFALTSDYNNGALPCNCDYLGSWSFECHTFGGQCHCKQNVIGRRCETCKTGFYGFPDCKPCDCPSTALCEKDTGECICPTRVTGERCDECKPFTYGFDQIIGCEECNCDVLGVLGSQLQCNLLNGTCNCKRNVVGRTCSMCEDGYFDFPHCELCSCDTRGTTTEICDQQSAECYCKTNVYGSECGQCKDGTFDLSEENEDGCTKCFCFGKSAKCNSANMFWDQLIKMQDWFLANIIVGNNVTITKHKIMPRLLNDSAIEAELRSNESLNQTVYFGAPKEYFGNRLTSYGGNLNFKLLYNADAYGATVIAGDVILESAGTYIIHSGIETPAASTIWMKELPLREAEFMTPNGSPVTREVFMMLLENLTGIYIRATYRKSSTTTRLYAVSLNYGGDTWTSTNFPATSIEECACPENYKGSSCEECAEGNYRVSAGPYGGFCVRCQCHGHAASCDVNTGVCHDCQHATTGDHCEQCIVGHHGNATLGTPNDCLICACPLLLNSNNFATACEISTDGESITCECREGYFGARCESCASGFYGEPDQIGDYCKPCQCSGNINPEDPGSCDTITGDCLKCMNNTFGSACALCQPGYYGDAIVLKNCQSCLCDNNGMARCDSYMGVCECRPGVIGDKCDRCEEEHWGFESGNGCVACNCSIASHSKQCDDVSGQCKCKPGVTGKHCDRCAPGFWNFSPEGCVTCGCNSEYSIGFGCNAANGHCECLQGVIGDKCDHCPYRFVLKPDEGCFECNSCTHHLLDSTDELQALIDPVMTDFQNKASGYFTTKRLRYIANRVIALKPLVKGLDPDTVDLKPTTLKIDDLESTAKALDRKAEYGGKDAEKIKNDAGMLLEKCIAALVDIKKSSLKSNATVDNIYKLATSLETQESPRIESAVAEAKQILEDIKAKDLSPQTNLSESQLQSSKVLLQNIQNFTAPILNQSQVYEDLKEDLLHFGTNLDDILKFAKASQAKAEEAKQLTIKNRNATLTSKINKVNNAMKESKADLIIASELIVNACNALADVKSNIAAAGLELNEGLFINTKVGDMINERSEQFNDMENDLSKSDSHMGSLLDKSQKLNHLLETTKNNSQTEHAVQAASAYSDIVKEISAAELSAKEAANASRNASELSKGLSERVAPTEANSTLLHQKAFDSLQKVQAELKPQLDQAILGVEEVKKIHNQSEDTNNAILFSLSSIPMMTLEPSIKDAKEKSKQVSEKKAEIDEIMEPLLKTLPSSAKQAQELPKVVDDTIKDVSQAENQLTYVKESNPNITNIINNVVGKQKKIDSSQKSADREIKKLKDSIAMARDVANRIKVGVQFEQTTTVELVPPNNVDELGTNTHVSAYFRTRKPNGFLIYLGNPVGTKLRKTRSDDFMALEIENGYPFLTMDIGNGPERINSNKSVSDDVWYQVIVNRVGKNVELTIREELEDGEVKLHTVKRVLPGTFSTFNLDKDKSKLLVGGFTNKYKMQDELHFSSFEGQIEDLMIGDTPVGMWNFVEAQGNTKGAKGRNKLVDDQPSTGYRFNGEGYAIFDSISYSMKDTCNIQLSFKTFAKNGLLFLTGGKQSFLSIEMRDGLLFLQFRLGKDVLTIGTQDSFNDGKWHTLIASRDGRLGELRVDDIIIGDNEANGDQVTLDVGKNIYIGGHPHNHNYIEVIKTGFDGCIDEVTISGTPVDLSQSDQAFGVKPGCPVKYASLVSFEEDSGGYVMKPNTSISNLFELTLGFKTTFKDGLMFYATNPSQSDVISLSLSNGRLVVISQKQQLTSDQNTYNDDQWHIVTVIHDDTALRIIVDDYDQFSTDDAPPQLHFMYGELFIGGVPPEYVIIPGGSASGESFVGCLGDAIVNGSVFNFAAAVDKKGKSLRPCSNSEIAPFIESAPTQVTLPPEEPDEILPIYVPPPVTEPPRVRDPGIYTNNNIPVVIKPPAPAPTPAPTSSINVTEPKPPKRPAPISPNGCVLGLNPLMDSDDPSAAYRFGTKNNSRIEFDRLPGRFSNNYDISVEFHTNDGFGGLIFYAASPSHNEFVALYMKEGKIHYAFNEGSNVTRLMSQKTFNDGNWHRVLFSRKNEAGKLTVDDVVVADGELKTNPNLNLKIESPYFYGGIPIASNDIKTNLEDTYSPFKGCLRGILMNGQVVANYKAKINAFSCSEENEEKGVFFRGAGFMRLMPSFNVGTEVEIYFEIKSRDSTGLLLAVYGRKDYLVLELVNNTVVLRVDNGKGSFVTYYKLSHPNLLCDGNWHSIQALKSQNVVTLAVDGHFGDPKIGHPTPSTDTTSPIFIGGHPKLLLNKAAKGSKAKKGFNGCLRSIKINKRDIKIPLESSQGDVLIGMCPTN